MFIANDVDSQSPVVIPDNLVLVNRVLSVQKSTTVYYTCLIACFFACFSASTITQKVLNGLCC